MHTAINVCTRSDCHLQINSIQHQNSSLHIILSAHALELLASVHTWGVVVGERLGLCSRGVRARLLPLLPAQYLAVITIRHLSLGCMSCRGHSAVPVSGVDVICLVLGWAMPEQQ